jgi:ribulose kinase
MTRAGVRPEQVIGIGTDFTACTVLPVLADGTPLCELPGLENRPHAYVKLWCHHAAQGQADRINTLAAEMKEPWLERAVRREDLLGGGLRTHSPTLATNPHTRAHFPGSAGQ